MSAWSRDGLTWQQATTIAAVQAFLHGEKYRVHQHAGWDGMVDGVLVDEPMAPSWCVEELRVPVGTRGARRAA